MDCCVSVDCRVDSGCTTCVILSGQPGRRLLLSDCLFHLPGCYFPNVYLLIECLHTDHSTDVSLVCIVSPCSSQPPMSSGSDCSAGGFGSMHALLVRLLEHRQLSHAGQLFTISDYDVITDLVSILIYAYARAHPYAKQAIDCVFMPNCYVLQAVRRYGVGPHNCARTACEEKIIAFGHPNQRRGRKTGSTVYMLPLELYCGLHSNGRTHHRKSLPYRRRKHPLLQNAESASRGGVMNELIILSS